MFKNKVTIVFWQSSESQSGRLIKRTTNFFVGFMILNIKNCYKPPRTFGHTLSKSVSVGLNTHVCRGGLRGGGRSQRFVPLPTQRVPFCTTLRYLRRRKFDQKRVFLVLWESSENQFGRPPRENPRSVPAFM